MPEILFVARRICLGRLLCRGIGGVVVGHRLVVEVGREQWECRVRPLTSSPGPWVVEDPGLQQEVPGAAAAVVGGPGTGQAVAFVLAGVAEWEDAFWGTLCWQWGVADHKVCNLEDRCGLVRG